jgi:hypothetical protein
VRAPRAVEVENVMKRVSMLLLVLGLAMVGCDGAGLPGVTIDAGAIDAEAVAVGKTLC